MKVSGGKLCVKVSGNTSIVPINGKIQRNKSNIEYLMLLLLNFSRKKAKQIVTRTVVKTES